MVRKLIQSLGPNCKMMDRTKYSVWNSEREHFRDIWEKLRELREQHPARVANKLLPQELSLIREYYKSSRSSEKHQELLAACEIAREALLTQDKDYTLEANILVEYCKLIKLLIDKSIIPASENSVKDLYQENRLRLLTLSQRNGDSYTQTTLLELGNFYYKYLDKDNEKSQQLLTELFDYTLLFETSEDYSVQQEISKVHQNIDNFNMNDDLFEKNIREGKATGIYIRAIQEKERLIHSLKRINLKNRGMHKKFLILTF